MASILGSFDCPSVGGLVVGDGNIHKMFFPAHLVDDEEDEEGVFKCLLGDTAKGGSKEDFISMFVDIVNTFDLHHLAILEENPTKKGH